MLQRNIAFIKYNKNTHAEKLSPFIFCVNVILILLATVFQNACHFDYLAFAYESA